MRYNEMSIQADASFLGEGLRASPWSALDADRLLESRKLIAESRYLKTIQCPINV